MVNIYPGKKPKFVKIYANAGEVMTLAFKNYIQEVENGTFPAIEHCFEIDDDVLNKLY